MVRKLLDLLEQALAGACILAFVVMFVLGVMTVVFRFVIQSSLAFPDELIRYLFIWATFFGAAIAFRRNMHAAIGVIVARCPPALKRVALLLATAMCGLFFAVVFWASLAITQRALPQISPALEISMAWVYAAVPAGMAILFVYAVELFVTQWRTPAADLLADDH